MVGEGRRGGEESVALRISEIDRQEDEIWGDVARNNEHDVGDDRRRRITIAGGQWGSSRRRTRWSKDRRDRTSGW